jgi:hypothetical protein
MELRFQDPAFHENEFTLKFLRSGKVVAKVGNGRSHYTLHPGTATGVIDLHKSDESHPEGDPARHERRWALPQDILIERLTVVGRSLLQDFWMLWRPLRLGWMIRRGLAIGPRIPTDDCFAAVTAIKTRQGPREANDPLNLWMKPPEFYEDVLSRPNSGYLVYDMRKNSATPYGVLITYGKEPWVRMLWAKTRDLNRWSRGCEPLFREICDLGEEDLRSRAAAMK